jgi:hypothetical protein
LVPISWDLGATATRVDSSASLKPATKRGAVLLGHLVRFSGRWSPSV